MLEFGHVNDYSWPEINLEKLTPELLRLHAILQEDILIGGWGAAIVSQSEDGLQVRRVASSEMCSRNCFVECPVS